MTKSEAISWFRIQEMFRLQAFHMYGIIGSALVVGIIVIQLIKRANSKIQMEKLSLLQIKHPVSNAIYLGESLSEWVGH